MLALRGLRRRQDMTCLCVACSFLGVLTSCFLACHGDIIYNEIVKRSKEVVVVKGRGLEEKK